MVHADGRLYLLMRNGETVVLAASPKYEVLAVNSLGGGRADQLLAGDLQRRHLHPHLQAPVVHRREALKRATLHGNPQPGASSHRSFDPRVTRGIAHAGPQPHESPGRFWSRLQSCSRGAGLIALPARRMSRGNAALATAAASPGDAGDTKKTTLRDWDPARDLPRPVASDKSVTFDYPDRLRPRAPAVPEGIQRDQPPEPGRAAPDERAGAELRLLHPDGRDESLVPVEPHESITDPVVSFDGQWVYFAKFHDMATGASASMTQAAEPQGRGRLQGPRADAQGRAAHDAAADAEHRRGPGGDRVAPARRTQPRPVPGRGRQGRVRQRPQRLPRRPRADAAGAAAVRHGRRRRQRRADRPAEPRHRPAPGRAARTAG